MYETKNETKIAVPNIFNSLFQVLIIIGAINWGLVELFNINIVTLLFGVTSIAKVIYIMVGVAGIIQLFNHVKRFF